MKLNSKTILIFAVVILISMIIGIFIGRLTAENTEDVSKIPENTNTIPEETKNTKPVIDLNTATLQDLMQVPGLSNELAGEIIAYREEYGEFYDVDELLEIDGITKTIYNQIADYFTVAD